MALTLRLVKGTPLTNAELDGNFSFLNTEVFGRARYGSGAPPNSLGVDGDVYIRSDAPFDGVLYLKSAGAWAVPNSTYTWATRPSAAANTGCIITISDLGASAVDFVSDGTNWIPIGKRLTFVQSSVPSTLLTCDGTNQVHFTDNIPAGLVLANCRLDFEALFSFSGVAAVKNGRAGAGGVEFINETTTGATGLAIPTRQTVWVENAANASRWGNSAANASGYYNSGSTANTEASNYDWTAGVAIQWRINGTGPDLGQVKARRIQIEYP